MLKPFDLNNSFLLYIQDFQVGEISENNKQFCIFNLTLIQSEFIQEITLSRLSCFRFEKSNVDIIVPQKQPIFNEIKFVREEI